MKWVRGGHLARRARQAVWAAAVGAAMAAGCTHDRPLAMELRQEVDVPARAAVLFFVDGLGRKQLEQHLAAGNLPNIDRYLIRRGTRVTHAFSCLPSITYPNTVTLLTGLVPGHHGIVGNRWFDRYRLVYEDYLYIKTYRNADMELNVPTIYDVLQEQFTVSIQCAVRRDVTCTIDNWATSGINWFFGWIDNVDKLVAMRFELISDISNQVRRWPAFIHAYFPAVDEISHRYGLEGPEYVAAIRIVDAQVGRICEALIRDGLLDRMYLVLVSDHGFVPTRTDRWIDVKAWLQGQHRLRVQEGIRLDGRYVDRAAYFSRFDVVVRRDGMRLAAMYLRGSRGWHEPADGRLLDLLLRPLPGEPPADRCRIWQLTGVGLVAHSPEAGLVQLMNERGLAMVRRTARNAEARYTYETQWGDPLGYMADAELAEFVRAGPHGSREWLAATASAQVPDFVGQIVEMFDSPRSGDVVLFAEPGWDFSPQDLAGHGSVFADEMGVFMVFAGPGIAAGAVIEHARTADVMPTIVELLGAGERLEHIGPLDGVSLAGRLLARPASAAQQE